MNNVIDDFDASGIVLFVYFRTLQQSGWIVYIASLVWSVNPYII